MSIIGRIVIGGTMQLIKDYSLKKLVPAPFLIPDGEGGTLLVRDTTRPCECGAALITRMSYVHEGTKRADLVELGIGASVRHYYTHCRECGTISVS